MYQVYFYFYHINHELIKAQNVKKMQRNSSETSTLESGINVPPWINIDPGKFGKKNKRSPIYSLYLYYLNRLYEVRNKAVAPGKKSKINKRRGTFIPDSRVHGTWQLSY